MTLTLAVRHVAKHYAAVIALADANLDLQSGEVLALIGANGSGKSTLSKIISGVVALDSGQILLDGQALQVRSPHAARRLGIATVFQELSLVPHMSIAENIWLTHEPLRGPILDHAAIKRKTETLLDLFEGMFKTPVTAETIVAELPPDEKQLVEILKAISYEPHILILDESTASLDRRQVERLFELIRAWKEAGKAIIFISHRMDEIFQIADRYMVLRNGQTVGTGLIQDVSAGDIVSMMVHELGTRARNETLAIAGQDNQQRSVVLDVEALSAEGLDHVSLQLYQGEMLGVGGLRGQGQQQLLQALFGNIPSTGAIRLLGQQQHFRHPQEAMQKGLAFVPGERAKEGLLLIRSILENLMLPSWSAYGPLLRMTRARQDALDVASSLKLKMAGLDAPVSSLSGGNAQKVVLGKWLLGKPQILLLDDPTKGVDVGAKAEFYHILTELCAAGTSIILYSSDDDELLELSDRILVMHDGTIHSQLEHQTMTKAQLVAASLGSIKASH